MRAWPSMPFHADAPGGLVRLRDAGWRLAVLTNCDDDLWATTAERLPVDFDLVVTAQQVGSYKPAPGHFERFREPARPDEDGWVHVACSWFHDMQAARDLGLKRVWVDRDRTGQDPPSPTPCCPTSTRLLETLERVRSRARAGPRALARLRAGPASAAPPSSGSVEPVAEAARRVRALREAGDPHPIDRQADARLGDRLAQRRPEARVRLGVVAVGERAVRMEAVRQAVRVDGADRRRAARAASSAPSPTPSHATTRWADTNSPSPRSSSSNGSMALRARADALGQRDVVGRDPRSGA